MLERGRSVPRATAYLSALLFAIAPAAAVAQSPLPLIPVPREVRNVGASSLRDGVQILCSGCSPGSADQFAATDLAATFQSRNISTTGCGWLSHRA